MGTLRKFYARKDTIFSLITIAAVSVLAYGDGHVPWWVMAGAMFVRDGFGAIGMAMKDSRFGGEG